MTPQQANDYGFLPEHPKPIPSMTESYGRSPDLSPIALIIVALIVVGAMLYASFYAGRISAQRADDAKIEQAWRTGYVLGGLCRQDPTMAACSPESLRSGGVL